MRLQIRHEEGQSEEGWPLFKVVRDDGRQSEAVSIKPPYEHLVGSQNSTLQSELRWYLEKYLELPIDPFIERAAAVLEALSQWGRAAFDALFSGGQGRDWYQKSRESLRDLHIVIVSNDASVLAWPWEALKSQEDVWIAQHCHMDRQLRDRPENYALTESLKKEEQLNILYVIARPKGENDVGFQTLARPLIDFAYSKDRSWPVRIDVLRPPTFDQLGEVLREKPGFYHIVHFDGHGQFIGEDGDSRPIGSLIFEKEKDPKHEGDAITAQMLRDLMPEHPIPIMVLNACQSAMQDEGGQEKGEEKEKGKDPFASVATSLMGAGIGCVVAMSYSLWVSGAKEFVTEFYRHVVSEGALGEGMRLGRQKMLRNSKRDSIIGKVEFHDWMVPVLYQQIDITKGVLPKLVYGEPRVRNLPREVLALGDYGFIGRDRAVFRLERAIHKQPQAGILIHGMSGEGKTTLVKGFLQWLEATNGLGEGAIWFSFEGIHNADSVLDTLAANLFGIQELVKSPEDKLRDVVKKLRSKRYFLVWDNFESVSGIPGTEVTPLIPEETDRKLLKNLLHELRGGQTKVLITSRSQEDWLELRECYRFPLEGLRGEELWEYCDAVVADLGQDGLDREDKDYHKLLNKLEGNPLAVRVMLLRLSERRKAALLLQELEEEGFNVQPGEEGVSRIQGALVVFERGLDRAFAPILRLLGLHERYASTALIGIMLNKTESEGKERLGNCFSALCSGGLCQPMGKNLYKLHPALRSCLTRCYPPGDEDQRAFVDVMGTLADTYAPKELHEQRPVFSQFGACFHRALELARELDMRADVMALTQGMASYALNARNFTEAERLYLRLVEEAKRGSDVEIEGGAYHQLGMVAGGRRDFTAAEEWYKKSLGMKHGNEHGAASTYHQLGNVAEERRDFGAAEEWYKKSLKIEEKQGNEHGVALTYGQLGRVAEDQMDYNTAEDLYKEALKIFLKQGDDRGEAIIYHQLGRIAQERRNYDAAEEWYNESLKIKLKRGNEHGAAFTYGQLGNVAEERREFDASENWYKKALAIFDKNDPHYAEIIRNNLISLQTMKGDDQQ
ncbi:MAG: tetratricopeptide repeat protein [Peptococcaceae bacterium]|nr:tetratricopeptide repeat protein [Peptococcaceae bacterium]